MANTLDEALGSLEESESSHGPESRILFTIDNDLRTITVPSGTVFGVYFDRKVQTINFEMPRYYHDLDLSTFGIKINYVADGEGCVYIVTDKTIEAETIKFSWTVDIQAFMKENDNVIFSVCLREVDAGSNVLREFNTTTNSVKVLPGLEVDVDQEDIPAVKDYLIQISNIASEINSAIDCGEQKIYCWGDSLTEGVGGYVMQADNMNVYMAYSYPAWLGMSYDVVNLGSRGEDIWTIMARQGADPIVVDTAFTIPASKDTPVQIGYMDNMFSFNQGHGLTSESGKMVKINREVESAGLNPCYINGVKGIIYRELTNTYLDNETRYYLYFKRLESGSAVEVPVGTVIETHAMRYYRNGVAIIWMGANGGYTSHQDFVQKVKAMVEYGKYTNYLVILSREFAEAYARQIMQMLTDEDGVCHCIYLMDELPYRGYMMAGISSQTIDTSGWETTDPVKKNAPLLCEYLQGQSGENCYSPLHYSSWGYKAIAKLIQEKLSTMSLVKHIEPEDDSTEDEYGTYLYKLRKPTTLNGTSALNTKLKLFADVSASWTLAIKYHGNVICNDGVPYNIFCSCYDGPNKGLLLRYYLPDNDPNLSPTNYGASIQLGTGGFGLDGSNGLVNRGGTNVIIIVKDGDNYSVFANKSTMAYGAPLTYAMDPEDAHELPLIFGGRWSSDGSTIQYLTAMTIDDIRVYDSALSAADAASLYADLAGL